MGSRADHAGHGQAGVDKAEPDGIGRWAAKRALLVPITPGRIMEAR